MAGWRCPPNARRKQCKDQVAVDVMTYLSRRLYCDPLMAATGMTSECGALRGLWFNIIGINWCLDKSSKCAHPDVSSIVG